MPNSSALPLIDSHAHVLSPASMTTPEFYSTPSLHNARAMVKMPDICDYEALCIPCITLYDVRDLVTNPLALYAKTLALERIYAFAGLRRQPHAASRVTCAADIILDYHIIAVTS